MAPPAPQPLKIAASSPTNVLADDGLLLAGFALMLVGFGFKVAAVPFHSWTPDVYQGSPSPVGRVHGVRREGGGLRRAAAGVRRRLRRLPPRLAADRLRAGGAHALVGRSWPSCRPTSSACWPTRRSATPGSSSSASRRRPAAGTSAALFYLAAYTFMVAGSFGVVTLVGRTGDDRHSSTTTAACPAPSRCWRSVHGVPAGPGRRAVHRPASSPSSTSSRPRSTPAPTGWRSWRCSPRSSRPSST